MKINKEYISGLADATLEIYEVTNGRIDPNKEFRYRLVEKPNCIELWFNCKIGLSGKWNIDNMMHESRITIYEADNVASVICDIETELTEIDSKQLYYI